jgi:acetyl-CoA carboxylase biotin carboxylase subunit
VQLQIRIAAGERLPFTQEEVSIRGHAVECRIYAEDPDNNYMPSPGKITSLMEPAGPGIRLDSGIYEGWTVPMDYDPLLAKLIAFGTDREQAMGRLARAIGEYFVGGIKANLALFGRVLSDPDFRVGRFDTGFLDRMAPQDEDQAAHARSQEVAVIAAGMFMALSGGNVEMPAASDRAKRTPDSSASGWKDAARRDALRGS